jgi:hypothetical protein
MDAGLREFTPCGLVVWDSDASFTNVTKDVLASSVAKR